MTADKALAAEEIVALAAVAGGDLLAQGDARGLPQPRRIISTVLFYGILSLVASLGDGPARFAAAAGGVTMLAALVLGPGGKAIEHLVASGAAYAQTPEGQKPTAPATASAGKPGGGIVGTIKRVLGFASKLLPFPLP